MNPMHTLNGPKINTTVTRRLVPVMAAASKDVPKRIEVMKAGTWPSGSNKGALNITLADLNMFKANFDNGIGIPKGLNQLPIDYMHNDFDKAAGWITELEVDGDTLYASVQWTPSGEQSLADGDFKCFSPSFWPSCLGEWRDPENPDITASNVLVGAGLTNIPFFKNLTPIMASNADNARSDNIIYINANAESNSMNIDELRLKDAESLTADEKAFIAENKSQLSEAELVKFDLAEKSVIQEVLETKTNEVTEVSEEVKEAQAVAASIKSGDNMLVKASDFQSLQAQVKASAEQLNAYRAKDVKASVTKHLERGAIKADQVDNWTARIVADSSLSELLDSLPDNKIMADEIGKDSGAGVALSAAEEIDRQAKELIKADNALTLDAAYSKVMASNTDLATRLNNEALNA